MGGSSKTGKMDIGDIAAAASKPPEYRELCKRHACSTIVVNTPATLSQKHMAIKRNSEKSRNTTFQYPDVSSS